MSIGVRLKSAREQAGISIVQAAEITGLGQSSLSEFENDKREPRIRQLALLAAAYRVSLSFFLRDETDTEGEEKVLWRELPIENVEHHQRKFLKLCEQYRRLEIWTNDVTSPLLSSVDQIRGYGNVEDLALRVGRELHLGDRPALVLMRTLEEDCGIKVFHDTLEPLGAAACTRSNQYGWAVLLNVNNTPARRNFDLAHELYHLITWNATKPDVKATVSAPDSRQSGKSLDEKYADTFAANLLMPADALRKAVFRRRTADGGIPIAELPEIARQFEVSADALVWRLHWLYSWGKGRKEESRALIEKLKRKYTSSSDTKANHPSMYSERYMSLAIRALQCGLISIGRFIEYTELSRREAMRYQLNEEEALGEVQVTAA